MVLKTMFFIKNVVNDGYCGDTIFSPQLINAPKNHGYYACTPKKTGFIFLRAVVSVKHLLFPPLTRANQCCKCNQINISGTRNRSFWHGSRAL